MNTQTKLAIIIILIVVPLSSIVIYQTDYNVQQKTTEKSQLQVVASFSPLAEFSKNVGGDKVNVKLLVPLGVEPHDWEPTIKDVQKIQASDVIIVNGINFESWTAELDQSRYDGLIVDTSETIPLLYPDGKSADPHVWLNPVYVKIQVQNIADAFSASDHNNQAYYQSNAKQYIDELDSLDELIQNELSKCSRDFLVFHDAFSYFAAQYNLNQHTVISSNDPHAEVTIKTLENVILQARELNIKVIFAEENVNDKTSKVLADTIGARVLILSPLEIITDGTYISNMIKNLENLKEALCQN